MRQVTKLITVYEAFDGKDFTDEAACLEYERNCTLNFKRICEKIASDDGSVLDNQEMRIFTKVCLERGYLSCICNGKENIVGEYVFCRNCCPD